MKAMLKKFVKLCYVALLAWVVYEALTNPISLQEEACFMSVEVHTCVRQTCPTVDSCTPQEHELVWDQCHEECVAQ